MSVTTRRVPLNSGTVWCHVRHVYYSPRRVPLNSDTVVCYGRHIMTHQGEYHSTAALFILWQTCLWLTKEGIMAVYDTSGGEGGQFSVDNSPHWNKIHLPFSAGLEWEEKNIKMWKCQKPEPLGGEWGGWGGLLCNSIVGHKHTYYTNNTECYIYS